MLDSNLIREKPEMVKAAMRDLNAEAPIDHILMLDTRRREVLTEVESLRAERNAVSKEIGRSKDHGGAPGQDRGDARRGRPDQGTGDGAQRGRVGAIRCPAPGAQPARPRRPRRP